MSDPSYCYSIFLVPENPTESDIARYANLRLLSLRTDPEAFTSAYERESAFTKAQWRSRMSSHDKVVVVAASTPTNASAARHPCYDGRDDESCKSCETHRHYHRVGASDEWIGSLVILAPEALKPLGFSPPTDTIQPETHIYALFAMWVHPAHRRRGVAERLIDAGLSWVRNHEPDCSPSPHGRPPAKALALSVARRQVGARALYSKKGFQEVGAVEGVNGEGTWMVVNVHD